MKFFHGGSKSPVADTPSRYYARSVEWETALTERAPYRKVVGCIAYGNQVLKKALLIIAVVIAPILAASLLLAAGEWRVIGQTEAGDKVSIGAVRVLKNNERSALVRVEYNQPTKLPQGGPFIEMRARVRFNCTTGTASPSSVWFYTRDRSGRDVVGKKATRDDQFGKAPEGGFAELVKNTVCSQTK